MLRFKALRSGKMQRSATNSSKSLTTLWVWEFGAQRILVRRWFWDLSRGKYSGKFSVYFLVYASCIWWHHCFAIYHDEEWRIRYNHEPYHLYDDIDLVKKIKVHKNVSLYVWFPSWWQTKTTKDVPLVIKSSKTSTYRE